MTDNEIKKALECCTDNDINSCEKCPIKIECYTETIDCKKEALDLINRQQADKEALIAGQETLQKALAEKIAEIERLQNKVEELSEVLSDTIRIRYAEAKAEAIKEFAERLKEELFLYCETVVEGNDMEGITDVGYRQEDTIETIDNLVKEMVGEE